MHKHRLVLFELGSIGELHLRCALRTAIAENAICEGNRYLRCTIARCRWLMFCVVASLVASNAIAEEAAKDDASIDFVRDIRPIFASHCFDCHGPSTAEGGVRLSKRSSAFATSDSGHKPIVPGKLEESRLVKVISGKDEEGLKMPPEDEAEPLSEEQIALLTRWVEAGAVWPDDGDVEDDGPKHWAFVAPVQAPVPQIDDPKSEIKNPIDAFILARLQKESMSFSPEADRHVLVRRVHLDLIGLPPTPQAVEEFVNDLSPDAYEKMVDRVLADPGYGERWARVWLDLARYADSKGYGSDLLRVIWRYRDWVIDAFNRNLPYDQFTIEQLAGDLLPDPTPDQILATAFHRNTMANDEGGTDDEEFRVAAVKDRAETTMQVWMGLTLGCAKCHTHKFDPITQREYYQFYAFFNQTEDADRGDEEPRQVIPPRELTANIERLNLEIAAARERADAVDANTNLTPHSPIFARYVRFEAIGPDRMVSLAEVQVFSEEENIALKGKASQSSTVYDGDASRAIDDNTEGEYFKANSVTHTNEEANPWWELDLGSPTTVDKLVVWNRTDGDLYTRLANTRVQLLDENRKLLWEMLITDPPNPQAEYSVVPLSPERLELAKLETRLEKLMEPVPSTPIMRELPSDEQRKTYMMIKGSFLNLGDEVQPTLPEAFGTLSEGEQPNRLAVAQWLMSNENPLTARVTVNRFWAQIFGRGIVESEEDFGTQGVAPTHPELIDWLAVEFRDQLHWDMKKLLKLMVMSTTYRQTSISSEEAVEKDPLNKLCGRGPRHRLEAEMVRDQALALSGLLSRKIGGPSVFPPQPDGLWKAAFDTTNKWTNSTGEDRYRRGLYTFWRRTVPYPSMATFDAPSREICTLRRTPTNTPLQAFVTLNDPVYVECAQALARRIMNEAPGNPAERAAFGLTLCLCRPAQPEQVQSIVRLVEEEAAHFRDDADAALLIATDPLGPIPPGVDTAELAAWTVAANVMLNLDGLLTKR